MIVEKQNEVLILNDGEDTQSSTKMSLDSDSAHVLMQMLSKNLYSDSIGSTVRETTSNGLDSHRRAGVTDVPIIVSLKRNKDDNYEFCVEDFGTGLDNDDIENIISKYGKSTKREEANALGMFGLGFKSPLAYSSSFLFVCRKNGVERKYMMYEGDEGNSIDLLYETTTSERNGVKIILPIKFSDRIEFYHKIKEQLCYFESVYFDVNVDNKIIKDDFIIHRGNSFQYSELNIDSSLHICLDNVYYPIDWNKLGIPSILIPVGLRFSLSDGLYPTPNRESLRYTTEAKETIIKRISEVAEYFVDKYNQTIVDTNDIQAVFEHYNTRSRTLISNFGNSSITFDVVQLLPYTSKTLAEPKLIGIKLLNLKRIALNSSVLIVEYKTKYKYLHSKFTECKQSYQSKVNIEDFSAKNYLFDDKLSNVKKSYIRDTVKSTGYNDERKFIKKTQPLTLFPKKGLTGLTSYFQILDLHKFPRQKWREVIKEFQSLQQLFVSKLINMDTFQIPQSWIDAKKAAGLKIVGQSSPRRVKLEGEVIGKIAVPLLRVVNGKNCKFDPITLALNEIHKHKCLYVYGGASDSDMLDKLYLTTENKQKVKILMFSERELKVVDNIEIHNLMPFNKFMEGKNKVFKRLVTANLINKLIHKYEFVFGNRKSLLGITQTLHDDLETLINYKESNFEYSDDKIIDAMQSVAAQYNLYDGEMYPEYQRIEDLLEKLKFLNPVMRTMSPYLRVGIAGGEDMKGVLCDLFKYYGYKIDFNNYNIKLDEPVTTIEEETIEQLTTN